MYSILRAYDTRLRGAWRRPVLYLEDELNHAPIGSIFLFIKSACDSDGRIFGDMSKTNHPDALCDGRGDLLVVQARFCHGKHQAYHVGDFKPIIWQILELHQQGFVYGDIRFFNIVLHGRKGR
jgi:hypothetical protein